MKPNRSIYSLGLLFGFGVLSAATFLAPQYVQGASEDSEKESSDTENGAKLWSANCGRCHNKRSPEKFSDAQWEVIGRHMRVRANLNGSEERAIIDFLKTAN